MHLSILVSLPQHGSPMAAVLQGCLCELKVAVTSTQQFMVFPTQVNTAAPFDLNPAIYAQCNGVCPLYIWSPSTWLSESRKVYLAKDKYLLGLSSLRWSLKACCATPISRIRDKMDICLSQSGNSCIKLKIMMQFSSSF